MLLKHGKVITDGLKRGRPHSAASHHAVRHTCRTGAGQWLLSGDAGLMKELLRLLLTSALPVMMGSVISVPVETGTSSRRKTMRRKEEVQVHLGLSRFTEALTTGDAVWVYQIFEIAPGGKIRGPPEGSWCDEYVLILVGGLPVIATVLHFVLPPSRRLCSTPCRLKFFEKLAEDGLEGLRIFRHNKVACLKFSEPGVWNLLMNTLRNCRGRNIVFGSDHD